MRLDILFNADSIFYPIAIEYGVTIEALVLYHAIACVMRGSEATVLVESGIHHIDNRVVSQAS